ncbi:MAG TPA: PilZ domain-containing protein [Sphingomicrobium sp.]
MTKQVKLNAGGYHDREPRIAVRCEAVLVEQDGSALDVTITDVSRDGFKLESRSELEVGAEILLLVSKLQPVKAVIRWTCGYEAGGVFLEPVAL